MKRLLEKKAKAKANRNLSVDASGMKGFAAKPELVFFILILVFVLVLIFAGGWLNGWFNGVTG